MKKSLTSSEAIIYYDGAMAALKAYNAYMIANMSKYMLEMCDEAYTQAIAAIKADIAEPTRSAQP